MARVNWSPRAARDLEAICEYIERDSMHYARLIAERIVTAVENTALFPEAGSIVPEYDDPHVRERFVHRFRIIHRVVGETVEIITIKHAAEKLPQLSEMN